MKVRIGFGLGAGGLDPGMLARLTDALEDLRFDSLWLSERLSGPTLDPLTALAVAAGRTSRLKLGTSVLVLPGRNPVLLAKAMASLDVLSGGRFLPAVGLGAPDPREHRAFGVQRGERAALFDEALPLMRRLWSEEKVDHSGPNYVVEDFDLRPKPIQQPLDVWLGGRAPSELRRVGRLGDGWLPSFCTPETVSAGRPVVEAAAASAGRAIDPEHWGAMVLYSATDIPDAVRQALASRAGEAPVEALVPVGLPALRTRLEEYVQCGFSKLVVTPVGGVGPDVESDLARLADHVLDLQRRS